MGAALGNRTPDLRITRAFSCVARGFKARAGFMFAGCCWRRSLAVDGSSGTSRGHASAAQSSQEHWPRPSAHTWLRLSPLETGCTGNTCRVRAGRRVVEKQGRRAHRRGVRGGSPGVDSFRVFVALVLAVSRYWRVRAIPTSATHGQWLLLHFPVHP